MTTLYSRPELIALFIAAQACTVAVAEAAVGTAELTQPTAAQEVVLSEYSDAYGPWKAMVCDGTVSTHDRFEVPGDSDL